MFSKVLIANRGAIACRIIRTLNRMGIRSVAVYSEADRHSLHVAQASEALLLGSGPSSATYLDISKVLEAAGRAGAQAIHPGYGFLSENAAFAEACADAGIVFIGPTSAQMRAFGLKHTARAIAAENGVPLLPGTGLLQNAQEALREPSRIGFPVMLKSTAGGGGIGMRLCREASELAEAFESVERTSRASFKDSGIYLEKFVDRARHIEVQIFGDGKGEVIELGERDCSVQRRNQKVIEETPAPNLPGSVRSELLACAVRLGQAVSYRSAGTVEFVYDAGAERFYFLEVNTRLQVEHGVTEEAAGVDLVEWMVRCAANELPDLSSRKPVNRGAAIQVRLYAEDPGRNFQPCAGLLTEVVFPASARVETWVERGTEVTALYDPMLAKIIVRGESRGEALAGMRGALAQTSIGGIETNLEYLRQICQSKSFEDGGVTTQFLNGLTYRAATVEVIDGGTLTTVQDYPGRLGYWNVGVPPSGPMDSRSFRIGNLLLGNPEAAAGLECAVTGPTLRFNCDTEIAIAGADFSAHIDGYPVPRWARIAMRAGSLLELRDCEGPGARAYILFRGGLDVPLYLGSASTFTLGKFGGHAGRTLRTGDILHLAERESTQTARSAPSLKARISTIDCNPEDAGQDAGRGSGDLRGLAIPELTNHWTVRVMYGPHGAPDFFTPRDIETFFASEWSVHFNSSRTGVRLVGPKPEWARPDGGEAGLHPSNIHDNAYAIGAIDFTGDMPVILGPDGPSLGGFVCPAVILDDELWKIGQLRPGDTVRFDRAEASAVLKRIPPNVVCRASGDRYLLIEYGEPVLDLNLRFHAQALLQWFERERPAGIIDLTPGIRSLQIHYDSDELSRARLLEFVERAESELPHLADLSIPSRTVHLPLSWDDPATRLAIEKYTTTVRPDAPWCPSNIEFIRRMNGLASIEEVRRIVYNANYLVLGLGDVYLGAPVATPLDPRHRLVTTKYNPARTWTAENSVGIGGAYLCVYGMEGPGGYQFVGRTVQMWNPWRVTREFEAGKPWLLRFFDQIRFYPVEADELLDLRDRFLHGKFSPAIASGEFRLSEYNAFLHGIADESAAFKRTQQAAFEAERERWRAAGLDREVEAPEPQSTNTERAVPPGCRVIKSPAHASVWNIPVKPGDRVRPGQRLVIVESMKMEIAVSAPHAGTVVEILCGQGAQVAAGQSLVFLAPEEAA
ncbi:MAG TPA: 5-oxoprolinase/urea amidolyase family protein [Bryobacteraceae bacterium]|nr:5-oxoprolinase/urea amidolyase family protein [Bryobacteraceae bacterium]